VPSRSSAPFSASACSAAPCRARTPRRRLVS
jgi:hypothetical protein